MKIKELIDELEKKESFNECKNKHTDLFFTAGFFMLSKNEKETDTIQLDYCSESLKQFFSFTYPFNTYEHHKDTMNNAQKISNLNFTIDLDNLSETITKKTGHEYKKIIAILQNNEWNITCIDGISIKRIKINAITGEVNKNENLQMQDIMRFTSSNK